MTLATTLLLTLCLGIPALLTLYVSLRLVWLIANDKPEAEHAWGDDVGTGLCRCGLHGALYATPGGAMCRACSHLELMEVNP